MSVHPGKEALYRRLRADIKRSGKNGTDCIAVDAACAAFKHRRCFPGYTYVGVDMNDTLLRQGIAAYPEDFAVCADITTPPRWLRLRRPGRFHAHH